MDESSLMLPRMAEVFDALRKGRHVCSEDGAVYLALQDNRDAYGKLFTNLGFDFQEHPRGFFYFRGDSQLSEVAERMAVFMFVLIEALATQGHPVEEALMTRRFEPVALPHFQGERSRKYMKDVGVATADDLPALLKNMERLGFAEVAPDGTFRFRVPACRFLELCIDFVAKEEEASDG
jgi:hypothetical protein